MDSPKPKKRKTDKRESPRKICWLEETPTDIMLHIFSHVEPIDLLNLSSTNKNMRASLRAPEAKHMWVQARANVPDLPDLPPDMTEWVYAALVFQKRCQRCGRKSDLRVETAHIRIRLCVLCTKDCVICGRVASNLLQVGPSLLSLVPGYAPGGKNNVTHARYLRRSVMELYNERLAIQPPAELASFDKERHQYVQRLDKGADEIKQFLDGSRRRHQLSLQRENDAKRHEFVWRLRKLGYDSIDIDKVDIEYYVLVNWGRSLRFCCE
ncbi:hypothetical protein DACRYDRAFT_112494 [Dacryopinax primogenitus]|uniref:F-box domain-containing protein n=1 Tax=Dacryopinax primogenitus (strain DJM 731) TaxID=1858805 RepID=M5FYZ1_DACPD|nr:uncharacterized protein DACRYDRAFT_112494 [Dacryopinax primogenitus]EJT96687.1 hypothetical protein DACRYDRAFT_112494 [Dacryopinax primogenitus]